MTSRRLTAQEVANLDKTLHRADVLNEFEQSRRYLEMVLACIPHSEAEEAKAIEIKSAERNIAADEYFQILDENSYFHQKTVPWILYHSVIMHLCSTIEVKLLMLAEKLHGQKMTSQGLADYLATDPKCRNEMKDRIADYILSLTGIDIKDNQRWSILCDVFRLRNIIAHAGGILDSPRATQTAKEHVVRIASKYQIHGKISAEYGPYLSPLWYKIEFSAEICRFFINEMKMFFEQTLKQLGAPFC